MIHRSEFRENEFTKLINERSGNLGYHLPLEKHTTLNFNVQDFYDYMFDSWGSSSCQPYDLRPNMDEFSNKQIQLARDVGYNSGNTLKRDWGRQPEENSAFKEILGWENFKLLGINPNRTLIRLLCYLPGNSLPVHVDGYEGWQQFYETDEQPVRFSVLVNDWSWGQFLQIHDNVITNWQSGDTYIIDKDVWHCSANAGILPKVTLTITGI